MKKIARITDADGVSCDIAKSSTLQIAHAEIRRNLSSNDSLSISEAICYAHILHYWNLGEVLLLNLIKSIFHWRNMENCDKLVRFLFIYNGK